MVLSMYLQAQVQNAVCVCVRHLLSLAFIKAEKLLFKVCNKSSNVQNTGPVQNITLKFKINYFSR